MSERIRVLQRQPKRISITLSHNVHESLLTRSEEEGRSVSNLCAFLLEEALRDPLRNGQSSLPMAHPMGVPHGSLSHNSHKQPVGKPRYF